eukprot:TRINITY_DN1908_c0_g1_i2.p1 TRINITY_DN1908_c0_g1~~TRINITY_DN1908_c0_g1_i2.p1  ORF type:complete len:534 (+),score=161.62 TRINITY_DN1908_c0_g1_i2:120-1721(+)
MSTHSWSLPSLSTEKNQEVAPAPERTATLDEHPAVIDDFIRNFLIKHKMNKTLEAFQLEWYEKVHNGEVALDGVESVPSVYLENQALRDRIAGLQQHLDQANDVASKARATWDKFRKERDFHSMHHKRVAQEKNKLLTDLQRLKKHYAQYEPTLAEIKGKYEKALKEKMLMRLRLDGLTAKFEAQTDRIASLEAANKEAEPDDDVDEEPVEKPKSKKSVIPADKDLINPYLGVEYEPTPVENFGMQKTFRGHDMPVAGIAVHPRKPIIATASDDATWKLWTVPNGDLIMAGTGHTDWVSDVAFHPRGTALATSSGDCTVKLWDFATSKCVATYKEHTQAVWGVSFHSNADLLFSCSMDHSAKMWDINTGVCRVAFRGHVDSVNQVIAQPYSNYIATCSGDKTVSLWDIRSGLCCQTFYGHENACNGIALSMQGDTLASTDADGVVKVWDVRSVSELMTINAGPHPANNVAIDRSGAVMAVSSDDASIKLFNLKTSKSLGALTGHEDSVQSIAFDPNGQFLVSCGSDSTFRLWA